MTRYELNRLNDKEFEALAVQIVQNIIGQKVERFKPGKDKGVDGRFFTVGTAEGIVQAKHWERSGLYAFLSHLEKTEAIKVHRLAPARYILVTSLPLSRANKQSIKKIFTPHLKSEADVLGNEDIQDFLRDHPEIVESHYKLWLASAEVLRMIFSAPIVGRSAFKIDEVAAFTPKYVPTSCHENALAILNSSGSIIITGEPGIGKSSLAEQLVLHFALKGFELCFIENALEEAEGAWSNERKQVFYFDDFLGRNYLEAIDRNHDSHVLAFMRRVTKDKTKRFILTSRTTILQQGKRLSELFQVHNIQQKEYEVRISDLTPMERARIFYNHLWFGSLSPAFIDQLYVDKRYKSVVKHQNFNPRLIAFITDNHKIAGIEEKDYWQYVAATLENPQDIWRGVFENQLDTMGRLIVALVVFQGGQIAEQKLRGCIELARLDNVVPMLASEWSLKFERSYQMAVGAVINRMVDRMGGETRVGLFNPSVGDFVLRQFSQDIASLVSFLALLRDHTSLARFEALLRSGIVNEPVYNLVMKRLAEQFWDEPLKPSEFASILASFIAGRGALRHNLYEKLTHLSLHFFRLVDHAERPQDLLSFGKFVIEEGRAASNDRRWEEFAMAVIDQTTDDEELIELSELVLLLEEPLQGNIALKLRQHVIEIWKEKILMEAGENGIAADYTDPYSETEYDRTRDEIQDFVRRALDEYSIMFCADDVGAIVDELDIRDYIADNRRTYPEYGDSGRHRENSGSWNDLDEIDDLFERQR